MTCVLRDNMVSNNSAPVLHVRAIRDATAIMAVILAAADATVILFGDSTELARTIPSTVVLIVGIAYPTPDVSRQRRRGCGTI